MSTKTNSEPAGRIAFSFRVTLEAIPCTPGIPTVQLKKSARAAVENALRKSYEEGFIHPLEDETGLEIVSIK
jgi:hypothetical protein